MDYIDLSDYAGLFLLILISSIIASCYFGVKVNGAGGWTTPAILIFIGFAIFGLILNITDLDDGSVEVFVLAIIFLLIPSIIYNFYIFSKWVIKKKNEKILRKIVVKKEELRKLDVELSYKKSMYKLLLLVEKCGCNVEIIKNQNEFTNAKSIIDKIENINAKIELLSSKLTD